MDGLTARHYADGIKKTMDMNKNTNNPLKLEWQTPNIKIISFRETESGVFDGRREMGMTDRSDVNPAS